MNVLDYDVCAFSTDGRYVASAISNRLIIRKHQFYGVYITAFTEYAIDNLTWNNTSSFILCTQLNKGVLQIYNVRTKDWTLTLKSGYFKFIDAEWISCKKILLTLEFHMALAVFDLSKNSFVYIEVPKPIWPCVIFDNNGIHMFVISKINGYEKLLMMHSQSLDRVIYIQDIIGPCDGLNKSPDSRFLCVFNKRKLVVLNFFTGNIISSFECILNTLSWAHSGEYLALGCSFGNIVILSSSNMFNVEFKLYYHLVNEDFDFFLEFNKALIKTKPSTNFVNYVSKEIASIAWSFDCMYLSFFEVNSTFIFIWKKFKLICIVEFSAKIFKMQWCQSKNKLSVVCGSDTIFFWTEKEDPILQKSPKLVDGSCLLVTNISWSSNNRDIILSDGKKCLLLTT